MSECWVELTGNPDAIEEIPSILAGVTVQKFPDRWGLNSHTWPKSAPPDLLHLRELTQPLIATFNEARAITAGPTNVAVGAHAWETDGWKILRQDALATIHGSLTATLGLLAGAAFVDGHAVSPPRRLLGERVSALQNRDRRFQQATAIFASCGESFPALWNVWEYIRAANDGHRGVVRKGWATSEELGSFAETADFRGHRHSLLKAEREGFAHTYPELSGYAARQLIKRLLAGWLDTAEPS